MGSLTKRLRTRAGIAAVGGALLLAGGVGTAAAVVGPGSAEESGTEPAAVTTEQVPQTAAPSAAPSVEADSAAPTVGAVDRDIDPQLAQEPQPAPRSAPVPAMAPAPVPEPEPPTPGDGVGTTGRDGRYTPAPPPPAPDQPPVGNFGSSGADADLLPSEEGYTPPPG